METWAGIIIPGLKIDHNKDGRLELGSDIQVYEQGNNLSDGKNSGAK